MCQLWSFLKRRLSPSEDGMWQRYEKINVIQLFFRIWQLLCFVALLIIASTAEIEDNFDNKLTQAGMNFSAAFQFINAIIGLIYVFFFAFLVRLEEERSRNFVKHVDGSQVIIGLLWFCHLFVTVGTIYAIGKKYKIALGVYAVINCGIDFCFAIVILMFSSKFTTRFAAIDSFADASIRLENR